MMGTVTAERVTFRGSPKVPLPLSSHDPPPSVTLKKSPSETRSRSEAPSTEWTKKRTRGNRAPRDNMYETRSRTYFSRLGCAFIASLSWYPGGNVLLAGELNPELIGMSNKRKTICSAATDSGPRGGNSAQIFSAPVVATLLQQILSYKFKEPSVVSQLVR